MNHIDPTAVVYPNVILGDNIFIGPMCVIGGPPENSKTDPKGVCGGVTIGDGTRLYKLVTIDAAIEHGQYTHIGEDCLIMAHAHVGHDCWIENNVTISCGAKIGGHCKIGPHCNIGLNAVLHQWSEMSEGNMLGALGFFKGLMVRMYEIWTGVPAKFLKENTVLKERLNK